MPLCYGGGVRSVEQAERLVSMGVEKVALSSAALADPTLVTRMADVVGGQSVVTVLDVRRDKDGAPDGVDAQRRNGAPAAIGERCSETHGRQRRR